MLSQENVNKLVMTGLYKHEPDKRYRDSLYWDNMYHCFNWTFKISHNEKTDKWYMVDTYFNDKSIELTDDNFDEFEFLFDFNEVEKHSGEYIYEYDESDWWHVAIDSGGMYCGGKYFVKKGAIKSKEKVLKRIANEINRLERELERKREDYKRVENNEVNLNYV